MPAWLIALSRWLLLRLVRMCLEEPEFQASGQAMLEVLGTLAGPRSELAHLTHIGVDALVKTMGKRKAQVVGAVAAALCVVYSVILFYGGWVYVQKMYEIGILAQDLPIPQWVPRLVLPIGFGLLILRFAQLFFRIVTGKESGMHLADEAADALKLRQDDNPGQAPGSERT